MTAKEKAWELYRKYRNLEGKFGGKVLYNYSAKQCALIAVNEILESHSIALSGIKPSIYKFWNEVKQEIEKL